MREKVILAIGLFVVGSVGWGKNGLLAFKSGGKVNSMLAGLSVVDDPSSVFGNPAAMVLVNRFGGTVQFDRTPNELSLISGVFTIPFVGTVGVGSVKFDGESVGKFSYARDFNNVFSVAVSMKRFSVPADNFLKFDISFLFAPRREFAIGDTIFDKIASLNFVNHHLRFALSFKNIGKEANNLSYDEEFNFAVGVSYQIYGITLAFEKTFGSSYSKLFAGLEVKPFRWIAFRGGTDGFTNFNVGIGLIHDDFSVDYAYDITRNKHIFSISSYWGPTYSDISKDLTKEGINALRKAGRGARIGDYREARALFQKAIFYDPNNEKAKAQLELVESRLNSIARRYYSKARKLIKKGNKTDAVKLLVKAMESTTDGDFKDKIEEDIEKIKPEVHKEVVSMLSNAVKLKKQGKFISSRKVVKEILAIDPDNGDAEDLLDDLNEICFKKAREFYAKALKMQKAKKYKKALNLLNMALLYDPEFSDAADVKEVIQSEIRINQLLKYAIKNYRRKRYISAMKLFKKVLKIDPDNDTASSYMKKLSSVLAKQKRKLFSTGVDLYNKGDYEGAIDVFEQVLEIDPTYSEAQDYLNRARMKLKAIERME